MGPNVMIAAHIALFWSPKVGDSADQQPPVEERKVVVVTGTQTERDVEDSPVKVDVIDREHIESAGSENVAEALEEAPGVRVVRGIGGSGIRLMGLDPKYTVILIDGQRVTGLVNGQIDLRRLPVDNIEQIEVVRGGGSVLYGSDAVAGAVNIITRRAGAPRGDGDERPAEADGRVSYGSFNTVDTSGRLGLGRKRWHAAAHGGYRSTDGFDRTPNDQSTTGDAISQWNLGTSAGVGQFGPFRLDGAVDYLQRDRRGVDESATGAVVDRRNLTETVQARLTPEVSGPGGRLRLVSSYSLFRDQFVQDQRGDSGLDEDQTTLDQIVQLRAQYDLPAGGHTLSVGSETQLEWLEGARLDPPRIDRQRFAFYLQDEWVPTRAPMISLLPGVRVDVDTYFDAWITPRIALMVRPTEKFDARVSYGRSYRAPAFKEMFLAFDNLGAGYIVRGNPELVPEDAWGTTLDLSYRPADWVQISGSAFETRITNAIVADTVVEASPGEPTQFGYVNVGNARTHGAELRAQFEVLRWAELGGSYQALDARDVDEDRPLPGRARHSGTVDLTFHHRHPRFGTTIRVRGAAFGERVFFRDLDGDGDTDRDLSPAFMTLDLRAAQALFEFVEVFVGVDNVLDAGDATTNPLVPRAYYGGISAHY